MANRQQGEVGVDIGDERYTLALDVDAMCALEDLFSTPAKDVTFGDVLERAERGSIRHVRAVWWASLLRHHNLTLEQSSALIAKVGGLVELNRILQAASRGAQPDARDVEELRGDAKRPQKTQVNKAAGTGATSNSRRAAQA